MKWDVLVNNHRQMRQGSINTEPGLNENKSSKPIDKRESVPYCSSLKCAAEDTGKEMAYMNKAQVKHMVRKFQPISDTFCRDCKCALYWVKE